MPSQERVTLQLPTYSRGCVNAWANLDGTDTFGLLDSFNVSSATDDGTGTHTITINNDMANNDYSVTASQGGNTSNNDVRISKHGDFATGSYQYNTLQMVGSSINDSVHSIYTSTRRLSMSTLRTNALEGVDAKNSITIVAGAGNITTTNVQEGIGKGLV